MYTGGWNLLVDTAVTGQGGSCACSSSGLAGSASITQSICQSTHAFARLARGRHCSAQGKNAAPSDSHVWSIMTAQALHRTAQHCTPGPLNFWQNTLRSNALAAWHLQRGFEKDCTCCAAVGVSAMSSCGVGHCRWPCRKRNALQCGQQLYASWQLP